MSDKYYNAYVDSAVGTIHEYIGTILQLKAQVRVANEILSEKDKLLMEKDTFISSLQNDILSIKDQTFEAEKLKNDAKYWEDSYHGVMNKVSHMETLSSQFNDLKRQFLSKCEDLDKLNAQFSEKTKEANDLNAKLTEKTSELETLNIKFHEKCAELEKLKSKSIEVDTVNKISKKVINNKSGSNQNAPTKTVEANIDDF